MKCEFCGKEKADVKKKMSFYRHGYMCKDCYDEDMFSKCGSKKGKCKEGCHSCNGNEKGIKVGKCDRYEEG